jgi:hypothetical protein
MTRVANLAGRIREVLLNGHWIANTNFREQLTGLDWQLAIKQVNNLNSIAGLTFHINYYLAGLLPVFHGADLTIKDKFSFQLPPITSQQDWDLLVATLLKNAMQFAEVVERMNDQILDTPFVNEAYGSWQRNIEAVIEHSYYHLGQISLIKKLLAAT